MIRGRARRALLGIGAMALLLGGSVPAWAAVDPDSGIDVIVEGRIGDPCVKGSASGPAATVVLRQLRGTKRIASSTSPDPTSTRFVLCVKPLKAGDVLMIVKGSRTARKLVPDLRLRLDVGQSRAIGRVPASAFSTEVAVRDTIGGFVKDVDFPPGKVKADGTFSLPTGTLRASDRGRVTWTSPAGDSWMLDTAVPGIVVRVGMPKVTVFGPMGKTRTVTLRASGGSTRATASRTLSGTEATVTLKQNGVAVAVEAGDTVAVSGVAGSLTVLPEDLAVVSSDGGAFTAHCGVSARYAVQSVAGDTVVDDWSGTADESGLVTETNAWTSADPIPTDWTIRLDCEAPNGLVQRMTDTVD